MEFENVWDLCQELLQGNNLDETLYKTFDLEDICNVLKEDNIRSEDTNNDENRIKIWVRYKMIWIKLTKMV